ncbi:MAG TPA: hypothetical protein VGN12_09655 [Pirellulales bacterium]|jgi:hypothetical protein
MTRRATTVSRSLTLAARRRQGSLSLELAERGAEKLDANVPIFQNSVDAAYMITSHFRVGESFPRLSPMFGDEDQCVGFRE